MISNDSRVKVWSRCKREYGLSYVVEGGLEPIQRFAPLVDGTAIHAGLGGYYERGDLPHAEQSLIDSYNDNLNKYGLTMPGKLQLDSRNWGVNLIQKYVKEQVPQDDFKVLEVETEFKVLLGELCYRCGNPHAIVPSGETPTTCKCGAVLHWWVGRADLVVLRRNATLVVDHKTSKSFGSSYFSSFEHSMQLIGYCYGIGKQNPLLPVRGYGINFIKKLKRTEPYAVNCSACKAKGCERCEFRGHIFKEPNQMFERKWFGCESDKKERFVHNRLIKLNEIELEAKKFDDPATRDEAYPMTPEACWSMRSGGEGCPFIPICWQQPGDPRKWWDISGPRLAAYYQARETDYVKLISEEVK